jgi:hypothetical protein
VALNNTTRRCTLSEKRDPLVINTGSEDEARRVAEALQQAARELQENERRSRN